MSFYVYFHKIPDTDIVFYVGKGRGYRARDRNGRNHLWRETVKRYGGFDVEIVSDNLQEWYAVELEADYILKYELKSEGGSLCNLIYGDISKHGRIFSKQELKRLSESAKGVNNPRADTNSYSFVNAVTKERFVGTRCDFEEKYGFRIADLFNRTDIKSVYAWTLEHMLEHAKPKFDPTKYNFRNHMTGEELYLSRREFKVVTGIDPKALFKCPERRFKSVEGWYLPEVNPEVAERTKLYNRKRVCTEPS